MTLDQKTGGCVVGEKPVRLTPYEFALLLIIVHRINAGRVPQSWYDIDADMKQLLSRTDIPVAVDWFHQLVDGKTVDVEEFRKWASSARKKIKRAFVRPELVDMLLPSMKRGAGNLYPADKIDVLDVSGRQKRGKKYDV